MKKYIIIIIFTILFHSIEIFSQNNIDPPILPQTYSGQGTLNFNDTEVFSKSFNNFILGWNNGTDGRQLDELMNNNYYLYGWETGIPVNWNNFGNNNNWYVRVRPLGYPDDHGVGACQAIFYDPAITINKDENFTPDPHSKGGSLFGFQNKNSNLIVLKMPVQYSILIKKIPHCNVNGAY